MGEMRVLRGGTFYEFNRCANCFYRRPPCFRHYSTGFRAIVNRTGKLQIGNGVEVYLRRGDKIYLSKGFSTLTQPIWTLIAPVDVPEDIRVVLDYRGATVLDLIPYGFVDVFDSWDD